MGVKLAAMAVLLLAVSVSSRAWEVVHQEERLTVSRRDYAGSGLDEIKGVLRLQASLNAVMALLKDAPFNRHWVYRSGGAQLLEEVGYEQAYVYGVVDAPFPMSDRDTVVRFDYRQDPATKAIVIDITNVPDYIPENPGLVRVPEMGGYWALRPEAGGWVEVSYQIHGDRGGWIPVWVANQAAVLSVSNTLRNMAQVVERYAQARSPFVQEVGSPADAPLHVTDDGDEVAD